MQSQSTFLAAWLRSKNIVRWPLTTNLTRCDDAQHSFECAVVAHLIGTIDRDVFGNDNTNPDLMASMAVFHEGSEVSGDINSAAKNIDPESTKAIKVLEGIFEANLLNSLPEELHASYQPYITQNKQSRSGRLVKAAAIFALLSRLKRN
jgi:5'-deoxynucleotidase